MLVVIYLQVDAEPTDVSVGPTASGLESRVVAELRVFRKLQGGGMPTVTTRDGAQIFYKDWGSGQPVVFSHGWPLNAELLEFAQYPTRTFTSTAGRDR